MRVLVDTIAKATDNSEERLVRAILIVQEVLDHYRTETHNTATTFTAKWDMRRR